MTSTGRTLVLAFDGTNGEFTDANTNVAKLCQVLQNNNERQLIYYQPGIGTYTDPGIRGSIYKWIARVADLAFAWYLDAHVMAGYKFLMNNYHPGDTIVMFGFSRGAYTARALAGMLHFVGLLPRDNIEQVSFAYKIYKSQSSLASSFRRTFCRTVEVKMLGLWETVASVGVIIPHTLPFTSDDTIRFFRHAVSLDEHRTTFGVTLWQPKNEVTARNQAQTPQPCVKEVWFAGVHTDVGGSSVLDTAPVSLSNITLRWMLHEIQSIDCGVLFDNDGLDRLNIPLDCVARVPTPAPTQNFREATDGRTIWVDDAGSDSDVGKKGKLAQNKIIPSWKEADAKDIHGAIYDQLQIHPWFWLLQVPMWNGKRFDFTGIRVFPTDEGREGRDEIHPTVPQRVELVNGYRPRARLPEDWRVYVADGAV